MKKRNRYDKFPQGEAPWDWLGITRKSYNTYVCIGHPLDKGRPSGKVYENSKEKLNEIKEKYKDGISDEIINEFVNDMFRNEE